MKVVASWSGGKDSCFAHYKAVKEGLDVVSLLTFMQSEDISNFHKINTSLLDAQANAINLPLIKQVTLPNLYEAQFKEALLKFKAKGAEGFVTGDIYEVPMHEKGWLERICKEIGLTPIRPLWQVDTIKIFKDFVSAGFKATVVKTNLEFLDEQWLGRDLDETFLADILKLPEVDPCGEGGEYHTIVTDGPNFKNRINLTKTKKSIQKGFSHLDISEFSITQKKPYRQL